MHAVEEVVHYQVREVQEAKLGLALPLFEPDVLFDFHVEKMPSCPEDFLGNDIRATLGAAFLLVSSVNQN